MATVKAPTGPGGRVLAGNDLLARAAGGVGKPVEKKLAAFKKVQAGYVAAEKVVEKAAAKEADALRAVAVADVAQDAAVLALASALAGEGADRKNPFKALGFEAPGAIEAMGYAREAKRVKQLVAALPASSPAAVKAAGKAALGAANAVEKAIAAAAAPTAARKDALSARHALDQGWETAYSAVKHAARAAEDDGARGLFAALFGATASARKPAKKGASSSASSASTANGASSPVTPLPIGATATAKS